jgi:hypothetical protein
LVGTFGKSLRHSTERNDMTNEEFVRKAYALAEVKDLEGFGVLGNLGAMLQQHATVWPPAA